MVKQLIFHLGDQKTGSTSIQHALTEQQWICPTRSIYSSAPLNHNPVAVALKPGAPRFSRIRTFAPLLKDYTLNPADVGVISAEIFQEVDPVLLKRAIDTYLFPLRNKVRLVTYVRPHAESILARFAEATKQGTETGDLEQYVKRTSSSRKFTYFPRLQKWRDVFGDRFTVRPFMRTKLKQNDVVTDFLDYALEGASFTPPPSKTNNVSLSVEDLLMLRDVQLKMYRNDTVRPFAPGMGWNIALVLGDQPPTAATPLRLHQSLLDQIIELYAEDARQVDEMFFEDAPLTAAWETAREKAVDQPLSWRASDYFDPSIREQIRFWSDFCIELFNFEPAKYLAHFRSLQIEALNLREPGNPHP